jgi:hypothetical protein
MKIKIKNIGLLAVLFSLFACEMELHPYDKEENHISFVYEKASDTLVRYTFAYQQSEVLVDTVWLRATVVGKLSEQAREVKIEQLFLEGMDNAEVGKHFQPFQESYIVEANETGVDIPIILIRDTSLLTHEYALNVALKNSTDFELVASKSTVKHIVFSDILLKPKTWGGAADNYFLNYGYEKHKLMIDVAAKYNVVVDDAWIEEVVKDYGYVMFWQSVFDAALLRENEARNAQGLGALCEGPEYGNIEVQFKYNWF